MTPELTTLIAALRANAAIYTDMPLNRLATTLGTSQKIAREAYWRAFDEPPVPSAMDAARFKRLTAWLQAEPGAQDWGRQRLARAMHVRESAVPEIYHAAFGFEMSTRRGRRPAPPPPAPEPLPEPKPRNHRIDAVIATLKQRDPATLTIASVRREFKLPPSWAARAIRAAHGDTAHDELNWKLAETDAGLTITHKAGNVIAIGADLDALRHALIAPALQQAEADGVLTFHRRQIIGDELNVLVLRHMGETIARAIYGDAVIDRLLSEGKGDSTMTPKKPARLDLPTLRPDEIEALRVLALQDTCRAARATNMSDATIAVVCALVLARHKFAVLKRKNGEPYYEITELGARASAIYVAEQRK